jgi:NADH-quinone oxidoreductase subunit J
MSIYAVIFYVLAAVVLVSAGLAVTRRNPVHAVCYLIVSFLGTALLFYLLGAPFLAALEVIVYAGAIMVLFLFIIMTLKGEAAGEHSRPFARQWAFPLVMGAVSITIITILIWAGPEGRVPLKTAMATPAEFGRVLFRRYWPAVEIASFLLFVALVGVLYLGRAGAKEDSSLPEERS